MENDKNSTINVSDLTDKINNLSEDDTLKKIVESCKVNLLENLAPPPVAMEIKSADKMITLFTKGNFSIITGPAKSRKTGLMSMLMAAAIDGNFQNQFKCSNDGINILFDTEQTRYKTQQVGKKISGCITDLKRENFEIYSLRGHEPTMRLNIIENVLQNQGKINVVGIDGIVDLAIDPILQADQAQQVIQKLMIWTEELNIHIVTVLHYNKSASTLLGHLGSFGIRKADAVIEVVKDKNNEEISIVTALACREREFEPFAFSVDEYNNPYILEDFEIHKTKARDVKGKSIRKAPFSILNVGDLMQNKIINHVFKIQKVQSYIECWRNIKISIAEKIEFIGDNKAKEVLSHFISTEKIIKSGSGRNAIYTKSGQRTIEV